MQNRLSIYIADNDVLASLDQRLDPVAPNASHTIARSLGRYFSLLQRSATAVASVLSRSEICLIFEALNGCFMEPHTLNYLYAEVVDAIRLNNYDEKWGVDGEALVDKLREMSVTDYAAIVDAAERFWMHPQDTVSQDVRVLLGLPPRRDLELTA